MSDIKEGEDAKVEEKVEETKVATDSEPKAEEAPPAEKAPE